MKKIDEHKSLALVSVIVFIALLLTGSGFYMYNVRMSLWKQSITDVMEITAQGTHAFEVFLTKDSELLHNMTSSMQKFSSKDEKSIEEKLYRYDLSTGNYMIIDLNMGKAHINQLDRDINLTEEELEVYKELPENGFREPYFNEYTGQKTVAYYERFNFTDGVSGIAVRTELVSNIAKEFSLSFFNDQGASYIINRNGDIIIRSRNKNSNRTYLNVFDVIGNEHNDRNVIDSFKANIREGKTGAAQLFTDKRECVFAYNPINNTDGWYVISIIPTSAIMEHSGDIMKTSQMFFLIMAVGLVGLAIFFALIRINHRNVMRKEAEIQYRDQIFNMLASNTDDMFFMFSTEDMNMEYISPNIERVLGIPAEDAQKDISSIGKAEYTDNSHITKDMLYNLKTGETLVKEAKRINRKNGEEHWTLETVYRISTDSIEHAEKFVVVISDRTFEHTSKSTLEDALAIAEAANRSKSTFLSNISHDIRTPMNAIVGFATLLQRDAEKPDAVREYTRKIIVSSRHLLGLINDVLNMSKIESGKTTLNIVEFKLSELIDSISEIIRPQANAKKQEFKVLTANVTSTSENLLGDMLRISQVLINILSNAVKYTETGGNIEFTIKEMSAENNRCAHIRFIVKDNGMGMNVDYLDKIFDPFSREENSVINTIQGTGLGLAITKNLVELMGGLIDVQSEVGKGSTFTVDLEFRVQKTEDDKDFWKDHGIAKVLVADDERDICESVVCSMKNTGVEIMYALGGETAVETARNAHEKGEDFDLYIIDWKMPDLNGIETARRIRTFAADSTIMILTAYDWDEVEDEAAAAGINGFLSKPFFISNFKQTLEKLHGGNEISVGSIEVDEFSLEGKHFLAAEDNELNAEILTELLKMCGADVVITPNGRECVERFESSKEGEFDAILMDIQMPIMNGYDATRAIRKSSHSMARTIPIIAMTANAFDDDKQSAFSAGMDAHIAKPVDVNQILAVLKDKLQT